MYRGLYGFWPLKTAKSLNGFYHLTFKVKAFREAVGSLPASPITLKEAGESLAGSRAEGIKLQSLFAQFSCLYSKEEEEVSSHRKAQLNLCWLQQKHGTGITRPVDFMGFSPSWAWGIFKCLGKTWAFCGNHAAGAYRVAGVGDEAAKGRIFVSSLVLMFLKPEKGETKVRFSFSSLSLLGLQELIPKRIP